MINKGFGNRILLLVLSLLLICVILTLFMMHILKSTELSLLEHQKVKLSQASLLFDQNLKGSLKDYLKGQGALDKEKKDQINILGGVVNETIASVKKDYPEVHMGLYFIELDVFYDGTQRFDENYSLRRKKAFEDSIKSQQPLVQSVGEEEGGIVEVYRPLIRDGQVEGVIRSAEYLSEIGFYGRREQIATFFYFLISIVIVVGITSAMMLFRQLVTHVQKIKDGVRALEYDINRMLPEAPGELGEIVDAVNRFARKISDLNLYKETMLATIEDAILVVEARGKLVIANNMATKIFNLPEQSIGNHYSQVLPAGSPFGDLLERTMKENRHLKDLQISWSNNGGSPLQILLEVSALVDEKGSIIGAVLCCRDITERTRLEEKLHRQERLASLGKLVAGVAHEIRNPLTSISIYIQHWQNQNKPNQQALATMYREVSRLDSIVDQLLYFAKPAEANFAMHEITAMVNNVIKFFSEVHQGKYSLVLDYKTDVPKVWIDPEQIERVLVNILFNAIQAIPDGGTITLSILHRPQEGDVEVSVEDNGCGISKDNIAHLFDPFFSTKPKGTGLGLAIAHEIIQVHGGHIEVESEVGRGTRFAFYLKTREDA